MRRFGLALVLFAAFCRVSLAWAQQRDGSPGCCLGKCLQNSSFDLSEKLPRLVQLVGSPLDDHGIALAPVYIGEVFSNTRGGFSTNNATQYQALLDIPITVDLEKSRLPASGKFFLLGQNTHGRGLTEDFVGDAQVLSNIDSFDNIMRVSEYWWEFDMFGGDMTVRLGKQDLNTEFFLIDLATDFIQSTFGLSPSTAFPTYPDQSMAAVTLIQLSDNWRFKAGIWDAFASGGSWGFSGNDSILVIGELEHSYAIAGGSLPGVVAIGAVYESPGPFSGQEISAVHEYILQFEQFLFREPAGSLDEKQGLSCFAGYYPRFPGRITSSESIGDSFVAGLLYGGPIPGRDLDRLGLGVAWTELFGGGTNQETTVELFYRTRCTPHISLQPDLQYIASPSGIYGDSLVVGLRFDVQL